MLDCPKLPDTPFFHVDLPKEANFQLSEDEWNRIKQLPTHATKLQSSWTDVMACHISKSNASHL
jgi:hypothetical protein